MINRLVRSVANNVLMRLYRSEHQLFTSLASGDQLAHLQEQKLLHLLQKNRETRFGREHRLDTIVSVEDYQRKVPISLYEDFAPYIERIASGSAAELTAEAVLLFELSSGSVTASKMIPYTKSLQEEFQAGIKPWLYDLYQSFPKLRQSQSYWSVTPVGQQQRCTEGGIPIGFEKDSEYLGGVVQSLYRVLLPVPDSVAHLSSNEEFRWQTAIGLLQADQLGLISVWNPTFLLLLLDYMSAEAAALSKELTKRRVKRGEELLGVLQQKDYAAVWPDLQVISCWADASAARYAGELQALFPGVALEPKGLLATEGFMSLPFVGEDGARLAYRSHFFEFSSCDDQRLYLAHQLQEGVRYRILLTTGGGFYRYAIGDIVEVRGFSGGLPRLVFIGKGDKVSDRFGEKLHEVFVEEALQQLVGELQINPDFMMLAFAEDRYLLFLQCADLLRSQAEVLHRRLDEALQANFHYAYCRRLRQLEPAGLFLCDGDARASYLQACVAQGQRLGDIKPVALHLGDSWGDIFHGQRYNQGEC